jgi:DNA-binding transcriptional regulator YiaG
MRHLRLARHRKLIDEVVRARTAAGLSERALAAKLKRSPSYVSKFEAGERRLEICEFIDLRGPWTATPPRSCAGSCDN